jgi:transglutaminase-like putative cysteine protease
MREYLQATETVDSEHPTVVAYARRHAAGALDARDAAVKLYYAVRDGFRYDAYRIAVTVDDLRASKTLDLGYGWCVSKAVLLAACCRAVGVPARLGFADVRNHLSTERMRKHMKTDVFKWHGYTSIHLDGAWYKATPAFNVELCTRFRLKALEFDGRADSIYHPFDEDGNRHMEYVRDRGEFADVPIAEIAETFRQAYATMPGDAAADFESDVARETQAADR